MNTRDRATAKRGAEGADARLPQPEQEAAPRHPALVATIRQQQASSNGTDRLQALFGDRQALTSTLRLAIAAAISKHQAAGQPVYFSKEGTIYQEDANGRQRPCRDLANPAAHDGASLPRG